MGLSNNTTPFKILAVSSVAFAALSGAAMAQDSNLIEQCREQTDSDAARIACLEKALMQATGNAPQASNAPAAPEAAPPLAAATPSSPEMRTATTSEQPTGIGAEQVNARKKSLEKQREESKARLEARVASLEYDLYNKMIITLDNGQVWKQTDATRINLSKNKSHTVNIKRGAVSGYRLTFNDSKRKIHVKRVK